MALAIARTLFPWRRHVVVPNLSWGMGIGFEIDLGVLSSSDWLTEVEIKVTLADLKNDAKKWRHQRASIAEGIIRKRYIAMPASLWTKYGVAQYHGNGAPALPDDVGRISVGDDERARITHSAKPIAGARKLRPAERLQMIRLGCIRYWALRESSMLAEAGLTRAFEEFMTKENAAMFAGEGAA